MADITISGLNTGIPTGSDFIPFSTNNTTYKTLVSNITAGIISNVQSDWNATSGLAQILNKPTIVQSIAQIIFNNDNGTTSLANGAGYLSTNITVPAGSKVLIDARISMSGSGGDVFNVALQRNGSNIDNATNDSYGYTENVTFSILDNPGAGTHTYRFYNQSGGTRNINRDRSGNNACYSTLRLQEVRGV